VERWHRTTRPELLDVSGPLADLHSAKAVISAWVLAYNRVRPPPGLEISTFEMRKIGGWP
jgi:Integrase core domain